MTFRTNRRTRKRFHIQGAIEKAGKVIKQVEKDTDERVGRGKPILDKTKKERSPKKTEGDRGTNPQETED